MGPNRRKMAPYFWNRPLDWSHNHYPHNLCQLSADPYMCLPDSALTCIVDSVYIRKETEAEATTLRILY